MIFAAATKRDGVEAIRCTSSAAHPLVARTAQRDGARRDVLAGLALRGAIAVPVPVLRKQRVGDAETQLVLRALFEQHGTRARESSKPRDQVGGVLAALRGKS